MTVSFENRTFALCTVTGPEGVVVPGQQRNDCWPLRSSVEASQKGSEAGRNLRDQ